MEETERNAELATLLKLKDLQMGDYFALFAISTKVLPRTLFNHTWTSPFSEDCIENDGGGRLAQTAFVTK